MTIMYTLYDPQDGGYARGGTYGTIFGDLTAQTLKNERRTAKGNRTTALRNNYNNQVRERIERSEVVEVIVHPIKGSPFAPTIRALAVAVTDPDVSALLHVAADLALEREV